MRVPLYIDFYVGPDEVRALPLGVAGERSVHYFWDYFSFFLLSGSNTFLPEGVVLIPNSQKILRFHSKKILGDPLFLPYYAIFGLLF